MPHAARRAGLRIVPWPDRLVRIRWHRSRRPAPPSRASCPAQGGRIRRRQMALRCRRAQVRRAGSGSGWPAQIHPLIQLGPLCPALRLIGVSEVRAVVAGVAVVAVVAVAVVGVAVVAVAVAVVGVLVVGVVSEVILVPVDRPASGGRAQLLLDLAARRSQAGRSAAPAAGTAAAGAGTGQCWPALRPPACPG